MARYYEETALIEFVKKYTPAINGETTMKCVVRTIREAPTADVVPKSEYEKLQQLLDAAIAGQETLQKALANAKTEVASEIIDEFMSVMRGKHEENRPKYGGALALLLPDIEQIAAELKKKYTEKKECPDCRYFVGCEKAVWVGTCGRYEKVKEVGIGK